MSISKDKQIFSNQKLKKLILPLIVEQALLLSVGMIDTLMIAGVGEAQVSGVSLVDMINNLIIVLFSALATGGTVVVSQFIGANQPEQARRSAMQLLVVTLGLSLSIMGLCLAFTEPLVALFFGQIEPDVYEYSTVYFLITALSFPFIAIYNCCAALFRAMGNSKVSMLSSLFSNVLNVIGNYVLIYGIQWGVAGAAAATTLSRGAAMVFVLVLLTNRQNLIHISFREKFRLELPLVKRILFIGIPSSIENSIFQLGRVVVVSIIAGFGTVQIAANAVANTIDSLGCIVGQAMSMAILTIVGQCVGMGDYSVVRYYIKKCMKINYALHGAWNAVLLLLLPMMISWFNLSAETAELATILILIHNGSGILLWPVSFSFPNALRAANDVRFTMVVSILSMILLRVTASYVLGALLGWGAIGVWVAMVADWVARSVCFLLRYRSGKWMIYQKETQSLQ